MEKLLKKNGIIEYFQLQHQIDEIEEFAKANNYKFYLINQDIKSKGDLLKAFFSICEFPDYFGFNWDALNDCLQDYSFAPANGYIFGILNSKKIESSLGAEYDTFIDIFSESCKKWEAENKPFVLLLG
ncbi:barstar family protein [Lacibacter sp. MH-610]|uniref:barstar family protein n=1 Tax=Lacibacter sp. MH-610 TaxID=3020883 RepID=UPI003892344D